MRSRDRIRALIGHFDQLVRAAKVGPTNMPGYLRGLLEACG
jgi:hypothetical protein